MAKTQRRRAPVASQRAGTTGARPAAAPAVELPRPTPPPRSAAPGAPPKRRRSPFGFLRRLEPRFVADIIAELRKVTWPTMAETRYLTLVVALVSISVGLVLGGIDLLFGWVVDRLFF
jgi:preprotein translocase subunit SecE